MNICSIIMQTYCEPWLLISKGNKIQIKTMNTLNSAEKAVCGANQIELQPKQTAEARVVNGELSQAIKKRNVKTISDEGGEKIFTLMIKKINLIRIIYIKA